MLQARQEVTKLWWDRGFSGCDIFISQETLDEAAEGEVSFAAKRLPVICTPEDLLEDENY